MFLSRMLKTMPASFSHCSEAQRGPSRIRITERAIPFARPIAKTTAPRCVRRTSSLLRLRRPCLDKARFGALGLADGSLVLLNILRLLGSSLRLLYFNGVVSVHRVFRSLFNPTRIILLSAAHKS